MSSHSLRTRLLVLAAFATLAVLLVAGFSFYKVFESHVERFAREDLNHHLEQLLAGLAISPDGKVSVADHLSDPLFEQPQSGLYWQVDVPGGNALRSRSLWDETMPVPLTFYADEAKTFVMLGPGKVELLALGQAISLSDDAGQEHRLTVTVAQDRTQISNAITRFRNDMAWGLVVLGLAMMGTIAAIVTLGLQPLRMMVTEVENLWRGKVQRITGNHPQEVALLVNQVNGLMEARERQLERARQRAGNLAHGLKTPLTVLSALADDLQASGQTEVASQVKQTAAQMRDLVDRELARSRMSTHDSSHRTPVLPLVRRIVETLRRAPGADQLSWTIDMPEDTIVAMDSIDLLELLGNLADNARKHARQSVRLSHDGSNLVVEDDGPGVPEDKLKTIARRGVKLDSLAAGSGLGLAIVSDLAEAYDIQFTLQNAPGGGLRAVIALPALVSP